MKVGTACMENSMQIPQKTKNRITIWSNNSIPWYISKENNTMNLKRHMYPNVHSSTVNNRQNMEATQVPINRWMDKDNGIITQP